MQIELRPEDIAENREGVRQCAEKMCGCQLLNGQPCSRAFSLHYYKDVRNQCLALERAEQDFVLLGQRVAHSHTSEGSSWYAVI